MTWAGVSRMVAPAQRMLQTVWTLGTAACQEKRQLSHHDPRSKFILNFKICVVHLTVCELFTRL